MKQTGMLLLFCLATSGVSAQTRPKYLFEIPVYPGTAQISSPPQDLSTLQLPFVTVEKIFKTTDGSSLNPKAVVGFYRDYYLAKGWKSSGGSLKAEPHFSLSVDISENLADGTYIQASGHFYLLVAPKDGMVITFLRQWRHSNTDQVTLTRKSQILARLNVFTSRLNYRKYKVYSGGPWEPLYTNEYIIDWEMFSLWDNTVNNASDINPIGSVSVQVMTYRDADTAGLQECRYQDEWSGQNLPARSSGFREIIRKEKILILIEDPRGDRRDVVRKLAAGLRDA